MSEVYRLSNAEREVILSWTGEDDTIHVTAEIPAFHRAPGAARVQPRSGRVLQDSRFGPWDPVCQSHQEANDGRKP